jgi:hypothetical protein
LFWRSIRDNDVIWPMQCECRALGGVDEAGQQTMFQFQQPLSRLLKKVAHVYFSDPWKNILMPWQ